MLFVCKIVVLLQSILLIRENKWSRYTIIGITRVTEALHVTRYTLHVIRYRFLFYHKGRKSCDFRFLISDFRFFFSTETAPFASGIFPKRGKEKEDAFWRAQSFTENVLCLTVLCLTVSHPQLSTLNSQLPIPPALLFYIILLALLPQRWRPCLVLSSIRIWARQKTRREAASTVVFPLLFLYTQIPAVRPLSGGGIFFN